MERFKLRIVLVVQFALVYTILAPFLVACSYFPIASRKVYNRSVTQKPFDAIIVPGVPFNGKKWSLGMQARVYWSWYLWSEGITENVIYSGGAVYSPYIESEVMSLYGQAIGIPYENIFIESKAEFSAENLFYAYQLAKEKGFNKIALCTDPFQCRKLRKYIKIFNLDIVVLPVVFSKLATIPQPTPKINAEKAFVENFKSIFKRYSFRELRRGTTGKRLIDQITKD